MESSAPKEKPWYRRGVYLTVVLITATGTFLLAALLQNINERKQEAKEHFLRVVDLTEDTVDPAVWGQNFPRQFNSYKRTVDIERTRHGGSDAFSHLDADPRWRRFFAGYAFSIDYREERGHAYMLKDQEETERVTKAKQPGACLHCHASVMPAYRKAGGGDVMKGFEAVCAMPWEEGRKLVNHPVACIDCHDPKTAELHISRPAFLNALKVLADSNEPLPHLQSIERWRKGKRSPSYDPNRDATRQELRSFVCAQCHVEYYFKGTGKLLTYPWHKGLKMDQMEAYYDELNYRDWEHAETKAPMLKAQHPEFETWSQGIHARSGVACADCHMPYMREGAIKVSDHHVRSPLLNINRACQTCHRYPEEEIKARAEAIQDRTKGMKLRAETALVDLLDAFKAAETRGTSAATLDAARKLHRRAQWRLDFVAAENSMGFHAPQETLRILGEAIDFARQGQLRLLSP